MSVKEKIKSMLFLFFVILALPYLITYAVQGSPLQSRPYAVEGTSDEPTETLAGILAGQIAMDAPTEAIRAQAVLVRTDYRYRQQADEALPQPLSVDELKKLWGSDDFQGNYAIAQAAVTQTAGQILTYEGKPIQAAYHAVSAGSTRAVDAIGGEQTPYLISVPCGKDMLSEDYLTVLFFTAEELTQALESADTVSLNAVGTTMDASGYVETVQIGEKTFSGDEFRELLDLPSPAFFIKNVDDRLRIVVCGKGHGIGLSQYAACMQAEDGATYEEILHTFFPAATLENI